jgi:nicotinamide mononucleotide transporter
MNVYNWVSDNYIEIFGAVTGIIYVFLEIRQNLWLWPVGIITSAVYIWVFFTGKLYADMSLQVYYLVISILGWYWWLKAPGLRTPGPENVSSREEDMESLHSTADKKPLRVTRITLKKGIILLIVFIALYTLLWIILDRLTDSPVPAWDSFITSLSIVATWMLARKIYEHWFLWIIVNIAAAILFFTRGLYATVVLYIVYCVMSFVGLYEWKKSMR